MYNLKFKNKNISVKKKVEDRWIVYISLLIKNYKEMH